MNYQKSLLPASLFSSDLLIFCSALIIIVRALTVSIDTSSAIFYAFSCASLILLSKALELCDFTRVMNPKFLIFSVVSCSALFVILLSQPASAQFLVQTQDALCKSFTPATANANSTTGINDIIKLVVGFVRGVIILAILGFAVAIGIQRDDKEQIRELVKTPVIILISTLAVDLLASVIVGSAGGAGGCG
jgi:hypothetical protein